jgi:parvulin-like peptidyl-prolyl isomerase
MVLYAAGALLGLGIAGYGLFTAQATATNVVPPEDLALINQRPILRSDFITQLESETGRDFEQSSRDDQLRVLDEMVREELLVQRGLELDFAETDQDTRNALVAVVNAQVLAEVTTSQPAEEQLLEYFNRHRDQYATPGTLTACNLVLPGAALISQARAAVTALRSHQPLEGVLRQFGLSNRNGCEEDFYFAARIHLGDALFDAAKLLPSGAVSDPIASADGIHILSIVQNLAPLELSFQAAQEQVAADFKTDRETRITEATLKFLRHRARILIAPEYAADYRP